MSDEYNYAPAGHNQPKELPEITKLAEKQHKLQKEVTSLEDGLKSKEAELKQVQEYQLPDAMANAGLSTYGTETGIKVKIEDKVQASLKVENRPAGFAWLEDNGYGHLIKTKVVINFDRGELEDANDLVADLRKEGHVANIERKVEPMTLMSFIKEQLELGRDIPLEIFSVYKHRSAKVKVDKKDE